MSSASPPRTLADEIRSWPDEALAHLLAARPDLAVPVPRDSAQVASRAATRGSVSRALDGLTQLELVVLEAVTLGARANLASASGPGSGSGAGSGSGSGSGSGPGAAVALDDVLARLRGLALVWGDPPRPVSVVAECLGSPAGLASGVAALLAPHGPAAVAGLVADLGLTPSGDRRVDVDALAAALADPERVAGLVAGLDARARAVLEHLEETGLDGQLESPSRDLPRLAEADGPIEQLLALGLLMHRDRARVCVPAEVAIALRGGTTTRTPAGAPPPLATSERDDGLVGRGAAGAAYEFLRRTELLLDQWGTRPPPVLRSGGLGVRELKAVADLLGVDEATAALHVEVAREAGLLDHGPAGDLDDAWLPTETADLWAALEPAARWARLAVAWLRSRRLTGLVGSRSDGGRVNALAPDLERSWVPQTRVHTLAELAALSPGQVLATGTGVVSVVERVRWRRPRRPPARDEAVAWVLLEAAALGVTGLGGLPAHGRALVGASPGPSVDDLTEGSDAELEAAAAAALAPLLPATVDQVLLQADLTAVAPGPLSSELARHLALVADVESRGGATVYRFTADSVRRAFDAGWSAAEVHELLTTSSRTPAPQALTYLVDDVARRFGTLRVGSAVTFLRSDDEAALSELVHHRSAASLRLRRLAPTVVVSDTPADVLLPRLRELGLAPVVEAADGTVQVARPDVHRARVPRRGRGRGSTEQARLAARDGARVAQAVTAVRAGDRAEQARPRAGDEVLTWASGPADVLAVLRGAVEAGSTVWIGYVDSDGSSVERVVEPRSVEGGRLVAFDHRSDDDRSFALHRITGARAVDLPPSRR